ncbi:hypothetical protein POM88_020151 [Heracleum sosnowskyi]|uniref:Uncharacterized protein n=1 Tax=Heracleum sosnowskyi TaxID=360622 RepID=A0AAD8IBC4_9APIA|nr:hypothetical protein POM88_020151 [Heracleum sosnowskyi]
MAMEMEFDCYEFKHRFALYDPASFFDDENVSDQHFNLYHTIDRTLFYRLVRKLGHNVDESMFVVAFLIWLERIRYSKNAVHKVISWPFHFIDQLANEIAVFFIWMDNDDLGQEFMDPRLLQMLCSREINLLYFREKRSKITESVRNIISEVCMRAFRDILTSDSQFVDAHGDRMWFAYNTNLPRPPLYHNVVGGIPQPELPGSLGSGHFMGPMYNVGNVLANPDADLSELFGGMQLVDGCEDEPHVAPDDRTIFLTFSKGYYIPESEIREFFTRIFGDFIEGIYMQDVSDEQPLYARMVCRSSSIIPNIAPPGIKTKYSIYGKQVWAKKYVKRSRSSTSE